MVRLAAEHGDQCHVRPPSAKGPGTGARNHANDHNRHRGVRGPEHERDPTATARTTSSERRRVRRQGRTRRIEEQSRETITRHKPYQRVNCPPSMITPNLQPRLRHFLEKGPVNTDKTEHYDPGQGHGKGRGKGGSDPPETGVSWPRHVCLRYTCRAGSLPPEFSCGRPEGRGASPRRTAWPSLRSVAAAAVMDYPEHRSGHPGRCRSRHRLAVRQPDAPASGPARGAGGRRRCRQAHAARGTETESSHRPAASDLAGAMLG